MQRVEGQGTQAVSGEGTGEAGNQEHLEGYSPTRAEPDVLSLGSIYG